MNLSRVKKWAKDVVEEYKGLARSKYRASKNKSKLIKKITFPLTHYSSIMGRKNYNEAVGMVKRMVEKGNYRLARGYVKQQIAKIKKQQANYFNKKRLLK